MRILIEIWSLQFPFLTNKVQTITYITMFARFSSLGIRMFLQVYDFFSAIFFGRKYFQLANIAMSTLTHVSRLVEMHIILFFVQCWTQKEAISVPPLVYVESRFLSDSLSIHWNALLSQRTQIHSWSMQFSWYLNITCCSNGLVLIVNKKIIALQVSTT